MNLPILFFFSTRLHLLEILKIATQFQNLTMDIRLIFRTFIYLSCNPTSTREQDCRWPQFCREGRRASVSNSVGGGVEYVGTLLAVPTLTARHCSSCGGLLTKSTITIKLAVNFLSYFAQ